MKFTDMHFDFSQEERNPKYLNVEPLLADYADGYRQFNNVDLRDCNMVGAKLPMISLEEANFQRANLSNANLAGATLNHVDFSLANLSNINLIAADIVRAKLIGANLSGAVMSGANLSGASLRKANLTNCIFAGANLSGVDFSGAIVKNVNFGGANLKGANLSDVNLADVDLTNVDLTESILPEGLAEQHWFSQNRDSSTSVGESVPGWGDEPETISFPNYDAVLNSLEENGPAWDNLSTDPQSDNLSNPAQPINNNSTAEYSTEYSEIDSQTASYADIQGEVYSDNFAAEYSTDYSEVDSQTASYTDIQGEVYSDNFAAEYSTDYSEVDSRTASYADIQGEVYSESDYVESESYIANEYYVETDADENLDTAYQAEETYAAHSSFPAFNEENPDLSNAEQPWPETEITDPTDEDDLYLHALDAIDAIAMESTESSAPQAVLSDDFFAQESNELSTSKSLTLPESDFPFSVADISDLIEENTALLDQDTEEFNSPFTNSFVDPFSDSPIYPLDDSVANDSSSTDNFYTEVTDPFANFQQTQESNPQEPSEEEDFPENSLVLMPPSTVTTTDSVVPDLPPDPYLNAEISITSGSVNPSSSSKTNIPPLEINEDTADEPCDDSIHPGYLEEIAILDQSPEKTTIQETSVASAESWPIAEQNSLPNTLRSRTEPHPVEMSNPKEAGPLNSRVVQSIQSVLSRRVQYSLQRKLFDIYHNQCAITGCDVRPLLETLCIANYHHHADHPSQCLVLRADLKTLYELKLLAIHPQTLTVLLAPQLFQSTYGHFQGKKITTPDQKIYHPNPENLAQNLQDCAWYGSDYSGHLSGATSSQTLTQANHKKTFPWAYWPIAIAFGVGGLVGAGLMWLPNTLSPVVSPPTSPQAQSALAPQNRVNIQVGDVRYNQSGIILDQRAYMTMAQAQQLGIITGDVPGEYQQQYQNESYVSLSYLATIGISVSWDVESRTATLNCCQSTAPEPFDVMVNNQNWSSDGFIVNDTAYVSQRSLAALNLSEDVFEAVHSITYRDDTYLKASDLKDFSITVNWDPEARILSLNQ